MLLYQTKTKVSFPDIKFPFEIIELILTAMAKEWPPPDLIADLSLNPNKNIEKALDEYVLTGKCLYL